MGVRTEDRGPGICEEVAVGTVWALGGAGNNTDAGRGWGGRPARLESTAADPGASPATARKHRKHSGRGLSACTVSVSVLARPRNVLGISECVLTVGCASPV